MELKQTRECDGSCCRAAPQFPNEDRSDCIYHIEVGCDLMLRPKLQESLSTFDLNKFEVACKDWPHNMPGRETGDCCWQWVES